VTSVWSLLPGATARGCRAVVPCAKPFQRHRHWPARARGHKRARPAWLPGGPVAAPDSFSPPCSDPQDAVFPSAAHTRFGGQTCDVVARKDRPPRRPKRDVTTWTKRRPALSRGFRPYWTAPPPLSGYVAGRGIRSEALRADSWRGTRLLLSISAVTSVLLTAREQTRSRLDLVNSFCTLSA
jgi:hypothetical protein